jgi:hypothetical protein
MDSFHRLTRLVYRWLPVVVLVLELVNVVADLVNKAVNYDARRIREFPIPV